jgi:hypothetical protein
MFDGPSTILLHLCRNRSRDLQSPRVHVDVKGDLALGHGIQELSLLLEVREWIGVGGSYWRNRLVACAMADGV